MTSQTLKNNDVRPSAAPFILFHLIAVGGILYWGWSWTGFGIAVASYYFRMFWVTAGYHRYFSHRSFKTSRAFQFVIAFMAECSLQKGVLWWAAHHRDHHKYSDEENDVHSPIRRGFWWSHVGWIISNDYDGYNESNVTDLSRYPELVWLSRHWTFPPIIYSTVLFIWGGWDALFWGMGVSTVLLWHGSFTVNSLAHVWGKRRYQTTDHSRNNAILALITMGEGWHNNHHRYQRCAKQGFVLYEYDLSYYILKLFQWMKLVSGVSGPPESVIAEGFGSNRDDQEESSNNVPSSPHTIQRQS